MQCEPICNQPKAARLSKVNCNNDMKTHQQVQVSFTLRRLLVLKLDVSQVQQHTPTPQGASLAPDHSHADKRRNRPVSGEALFCNHRKNRPLHFPQFVWTLRDRQHNAEGQRSLDQMSWLIRSTSVHPRARVGVSEWSTRNSKHTQEFLSFRNRSFVASTVN